MSACWDEVNVTSCMENTRVQLLADIMSWAESPTSPVVFWLNGLAGTGKSTIARTMCNQFAEKDLLGASFFMSRQVEERRLAPTIIRTIAYQLARHHPAFFDAISATLQDSPELASAEGLQKLTSELLFKPASALVADACILIVIDALDECMDDSRGRPGGELLPLLLRGLSRLSGRVKLLLTSRAEPAISRMFNDASLGSQQKLMQLHESDSAMVRADIRTYLTRSFANISKDHSETYLRGWPSQEDLDTVVRDADALFVFAATVVRFVGTPNQNPRTRLDIMLARGEGNSGSPYRCLDRLYLQVLRTSVRSEEQKDVDVQSERLRVVMGSVVTAQQPLSVAAHALLLDRDPVDVQLAVGSLSGLLLGTGDEPVRIFHPSFPDFIVDSQRCDEQRFLVVVSEHHLRLARGCLELLNRHLRYNIANLDGPDVANLDVRDLNGRLSRSICEKWNHLGSALPQALLYAARHWATHIISSLEMDSKLLNALSIFCNDHLFHWIELLSLTQSLSNNIHSILLAVIRWSAVRSFSSSLLSANTFTRALSGMSGSLRSAVCFTTQCA
jgi:hypothetical protein